MTDLYIQQIINRLLHFVRNDGALLIMRGSKEGGGLQLFSESGRMTRRLLFSLPSCVIAVIATARYEAGSNLLNILQKRSVIDEQLIAVIQNF